MRPGLNAEKYGCPQVVRLIDFQAMEPEAIGRVCAVCGERVGVYEPIMVLSGGVLWRTSLAKDPELTPVDVVMHVACAPELPDSVE